MYDIHLISWIEGKYKVIKNVKDCPQDLSHYCDLEKISENTYRIRVYENYINFYPHSAFYSEVKS